VIAAMKNVAHCIANCLAAGDMNTVADIKFRVAVFHRQVLIKM
jgi:hypothetical protein